MAGRLTHYITVFLFAAAVFAAKGDVEVRLKEGVDFSGYSTYSWAPHPDLVEGHPLADGSPLDTEIKTTADTVLAGKGLVRVAGEEAHDLLINYVGFARETTEIEGVKKQLASGVSWVGDVNAHTMRAYSEGTLVFEVVDTESGDMVWSGWITELAPTVEKLKAKAGKATRRVFKYFPD